MHRSVSFNVAGDTDVRSPAKNSVVPIKSAPLIRQANAKEAERSTNFEPSKINTGRPFQSQRSSSVPLVCLNEALNKGGGVVERADNATCDDDTFSFVQTAPLQVHEKIKLQQKGYTKIELPVVELGNSSSAFKSSSLVQSKGQNDVAGCIQVINHKVTTNQTTDQGKDPSGNCTPNQEREMDVLGPESGFINTGSAMTQCSFKMIRSNGGFRPVLKDNSGYFSPDELHSTPKSNVNPIRAISVTDSSFFDIETPSDESDIIRESPLPDEQGFYITSPHNPPFDPASPGSMRDNSLRQDIIRSQSSRFLPMVDYFQEYMEDRLVSWRPGESQFNNDAMMSGNHPYQQYQENIKNGMNKSLFSSLRKWFSNERQDESPSAERASSVPINADYNKAPCSGTLTNARVECNSNTPELVHILGRSEFKANSSNSFLPHACSTSKSEFSPSTNAAIFMKDEPCPIVEAPYTPKAIPFYAFELNYEKKPNDVSGPGPNAEIVDAIDEDVRNLIEGSENFLSDCFSGLLSLFCP